MKAVDDFAKVMSRFGINNLRVILWVVVTLGYPLLFLLDPGFALVLALVAVGIISFLGASGAFQSKDPIQSIQTSSGWLYRCPNCSTYDNAPYNITVHCGCGVWRYLAMSSRPYWVLVPPPQFPKNLVAVQ